jgi:hypothetical protein
MQPKEQVTRSRLANGLVLKLCVTPDLRAEGLGENDDLA